MALHLRAKRPVLTTKLLGASVAVLALLLQPFGALPLPVASAASLSVTPTSHTQIDGNSAGTARAESTSNAEGYENLSYSFDYDISKLEPGKVFTYGWRTTAGVDQNLGTIEGQTNTNNQPGSNEIGNKVVSLPTEAAVGGLKLFFKHNGNLTGSNDRVQVTNISLSGDSIPVEEQNAVCDSGCEWTTVADAVAGEAAGSTIIIKADSAKIINSTILANKQLTITGEPGAKIQTSGSSHVFVTTAAGVTISNLVFEKTDKVNQSMINIQGANTTISGNSFSGKYTLAENDHTSRALEVSTTTGLNVIGNIFSNLRQPAYVNDNSTGSITNNSVDETRGWVLVANTDFSFSGNTFGTNAVDIAFIPGAPNNYPCDRLAAIKSANDNAVIDNQALVRKCVTPPALQDVVVRSSNPQGWTAIDDNGNGGSQSYVQGPGTPPLGNGSAQLTVDSANQGYLFAKAAYGGTKLSEIADISYSTYTQSGNDLWAPSLQLNVTPDVNAAAAWHGRLVYEPYMNGTVTDGTWQDWDATAGKWWLTKPASFANQCGQSTPCTFEQLVAHYPNIGINTGNLTAVGFKAGSSWTNYTGNVDNFTFASATAHDRYDFEAEVPDTTKPTVELLNPAAGALNPTQYQVKAIDNKKLDLVTGNLYKGTTLIKSCSNRNLDTAEHTLTCSVPGNLEDGVYSIRYNAKDQAGNVSQTMTSTFEVDRSAPDVQIVSPAQGAAVRGTVNVRGDIDDANRKVSYMRITGPEGYVTTSYFADGRESHEYVWNTSALANGTYTIRFEARDAAGNKDAGSVQDIRVVVDNTKGTTVVNTPLENALVREDFTVNAVSSDEQTGIVRGVANLYRADNTLLKTCYNQTLVTAEQSHDFSCTVNVDELADGDYYLRVNAVDRAGNITNTVTRNFTVDTSGPSLNISTPTQDAEYGEGSPIEVTGSATDTEKLDRVVIFINGRYVGTYDSRQVQNSFESDQGGDYRFVIPAGTLPAGEYRLVVNAYDAAGNSTTQRVDVKLNEPAPIVVTDPDGETEVDEGDEGGESPTGGNSPTGTGTQGGSNQQGGSATANGLTTAPQLGQGPIFIASNQGSNLAAQDTESQAEDDGDILGTSSTEDEDNGDIAGASDKAGWSIGDMAWYWWVAGVLGLMALWLLIAAGIRRLRGTDA